MNIKEIKDFILSLKNPPKIYIGTDSKIVIQDNKQYIKYSTTVIIHYFPNSGGKIFSSFELENNYFPKNKPKYRLLQETYKSANVYIELHDMLPSHYYEIHLDLNPDKRFKSNQAVSESVAYVKSITGLTPKLKPLAIAATSCANKFL